MDPGVYQMSHELYHADPCPVASLSRGTIMDLLNECPKKAQFNHPRLNPAYRPDDDEKFDIGKVAHFMFLEGKNSVEVVDAKDWRTKAAQEARAKAKSEGKIALLEDQYARVRAMVQHAYSELAGSELGIEDLGFEGDSELTYIWREDEAWCRVRPDWISKDRKIILDYKTTGSSADPDAFVKSIISYGYDVQESFYRRGVKSVEGKAPKFFFMVQETSEPYLCSFIALPPMFQSLGEQKVNWGLDIWRRCMETNRWPAYPNKVCFVDVPAWALTQWEYKAQNISLEG
jgi:hypothetical protein